MHRISAALLLRLGVAAAVVAVGGIRTAAAQQRDVAVATRGPRFLFAPTPKAAPVPLDVHRNALLRKVVSLNFERPNVGQVLAAIERQTDLKFFYSREVLSADRPVSLRADSITVAAALMAVLIDTGVDVLLSRGMQIALVKRSGSESLWQGGSIVGRVTDSASGRGIKGADVFLEGTSSRTETDTTGQYRLSNVDTGTYTLVVRRLGYLKQSRRVTVREAETDTVDVVLGSQATKLDELVTTATGQQRRRDLGNAITTIHADSVLQTAPIRNLTDLLEDRVPGLTVQHTSGAPGDPARMRLRGLGSVLRSNDPVVIVDGVRVYAAQAEARSGNLANLQNRQAMGGGVRAHIPSSQPAPSPLDQIDPNIIETIEVFKGPSAATLYGADAANGVIVITTKRGKPGPTRWNVKIEHGRTNPLGRYSEGYYRWGHGRFDNVARFCPLNAAYCLQDSLTRFQALNQPDLTLLGQGQRTALSLTASGGSQALTYSLTGTYSDETGLLEMPAFEIDRFRTRFSREAPDWMRRPHRYERWNVSSRVMARLSPSADVTLSTTLSRSEQQRSTLESQVARLAGTYVDTINGVYYRPSDGLQIANAEYLESFYTRTTAEDLNFTTSLNGSWRPRPWVDVVGQAGLNVIPRDHELLLPAGLIEPNDSGVLVRGAGNSLVSTFNLQGSVRRPLRWGFLFEASVGANLTTTNTADLATTAVGLLPGRSVIDGSESITARELRSSSSVFGWYIEPRVKGRTLSLSAGLRLDGGSTYGTRIAASGGSGLGNLLALPKLNGSWVISEEPWFPFTSLFSSLRLRAAYGQAQVQPGAADRLRLYKFTTVGNLATSTIELSTLGNTQLRPERSTEIEGGFDADLLDSRISVELTVYRKVKVDALMRTAIAPSVNGGGGGGDLGGVIQNIGDIRNTGLDLSVQLTPVQSRAMVWSVQLHYNRNNNELVKLGRGVVPNKEDGLVAGYPLYGRWARPILGYADDNDNGVLEPNEVIVGDSSVFMGRLLPAYTTGVFTNVALFGGTIGVTAGFSYESGAVQVNRIARDNWVLSRGRSDPSAPLGEQAAVVAALDLIGTNGTDYGLMQDVSTFRFTSLSVNYRAPQRVARLVRAQQLTIGVQGANLGLHSTYQGKDPDVTSWSAGENISDTGQLPLPRTWQLAVSLQY